MSTAPQTAADVERLASLLDEQKEGLLTCVHCGLCLPACPTYRVIGDENDSPRGRIYLMRALVEGRLEPGGTFASHIDQCLGCRGCEPVCPSGVPYGRLLESARVEAAKVQRRRRSPVALATRFILNQVFTRPPLLATVMACARLLRDSRLAELALESGAVSGRLRLALALLVATRPSVSRSRAEAGVNPAPPKKPAVRVALLKGCVMEGLFGNTNRATERMLARAGCEIVEAPDQGCCGALHAHSGEVETARRLALQNIRAFVESGCDFVITNAAGCGAAMKEYRHLFEPDPEQSARAREFSAKVKDISEFLAETGIQPPTSKLTLRIVYDAPCHLIHAQRIATAPIDLLSNVGGIEVKPLQGFETCCGGAGIYNLIHPDISRDILAEKVENIRRSGADAVATGNPGCIMQIKAGLTSAGLDTDVLHPVDLLDALYS